MRIIPVSRRDIQYGVNTDPFFGVRSLPFATKLHIYHLEVNENCLETKIIALVGAFMVKGRSFIYNSNFCDGSFPVKIYLKVDDETIQRAMNANDITTILDNALHVVAVGMTTLGQGINIEQGVNKHEKTDLKETDLKTETNLEINPEAI